MNVTTLSKVLTLLLVRGMCGSAEETFDTTHMYAVKGEIKTCIHMFCSFDKETVGSGSQCDARFESDRYSSTSTIGRIEKQFTSLLKLIT